MVLLLNYLWIASFKLLRIFEKFVECWLTSWSINVENNGVLGNN